MTLNEMFAIGILTIATIGFLVLGVLLIIERMTRP